MKKIRMRFSFFLFFSFFFFWENIKDFQALQISSWNIRHFFRFGLKSSISQNITKLHLQKYKKFFRGFYFLKYKKFFLGWIFLNFLWPWAGKCSASRKYKKDFFWENIRVFLILELEGCISRNVRNFFRGRFFKLFLGLGWEVR